MTRKLEVSELAKNYPESDIRKMFEYARENPDIINMSAGDPNFETPQYVKEAAKKAIDEGYTNYCPTLGIPELRSAIADMYSPLWPGLQMHNVAIGVGALESMTLALLAVLDKGDEVLLPEPYFTNYLGQIMIAGGVPVTVPVSEEKDYIVQVEDLEKALSDRTKVIIINSPNNPVGSVMKKEDILAVADFAKKHDLFIFSDEPYDKIVFGDDFFSFANVEEVRDRLFLFNSFSKAYAMTGWRLGYCIFDAKFESYISHIQEGMVSCVNTFIQYAALAALKGPRNEQKAMVAEYEKRRDIAVAGFNAIPGISCKNFTGSFYAFLNIKAFGKSSSDFAWELCKNARVSTVPGTAFGDSGEGYIRLALTTSAEDLKEAIRRIDSYVRKAYPDIV